MILLVGVCNNKKQPFLLRNFWNYERLFVSFHVCKFYWETGKFHVNRQISSVLEYRSGTVNSNTVNSKFHFIRSLWELFLLSFHV